MSIAGGISKAVYRAHEIGCETFQIFTKNQMQWKIPELDGKETEKFKSSLKKFRIAPGTVHSSYLVNIASPDEKTRLRSINDLSEDLKRAERLGINFLVFHPGAHKGKGVEYALSAIVEGIDEILRRNAGSGTMLLLETTAGEGTNVGNKFEHLSYIIGRVKSPERVGVCIDTCHIFAAGYDIRTKEAYENTMKEVKNTVGFEKVKAFHLNDSKRELGSGIDRHAEIGKGIIGLDAFDFLVNDPNFENVPGILETPGGETAYKRNIRILKNLRRRKQDGYKRER